MSVVICPCCGQPASEVSPEGLRHVEASPLAKNVLDKLIAAYPRSVPVDQVIMAAYWGAREPDNPNQVIRQILHRLRKVLAPHGWTVPPELGGRGNAARYRLAVAVLQEPRD